MHATRSIPVGPWITAALLVVACCGAGCGGGSTDGEAAQSNGTSTVAAHRATAEALFDHVRSVCNLEYPDAESYYALVYAETPAQTMWMGFVADHELPKYRFAQACWERYGELPLLRRTFVWEIDDFSWQSVDADRALIDVENRNGVKRPLHLVRVGDLWWISGYTFERSDFGFDEPNFERFARSMAGQGPYVDAVTNRIRRGEFATLEEAEAAHLAAISAWGLSRSAAP